MDFSLIVESYRNMKRLKEGKITSLFVNWGKTAQQMKALAAKPKDMCSIPGTHRVARTDSFKPSLGITHGPTSTYTTGSLQKETKTGNTSA